MSKIRKFFRVGRHDCRDNLPDISKVMPGVVWMCNCGVQYVASGSKVGSPVPMPTRWVVFSYDARAGRPRDPRPGTKP